ESMRTVLQSPRSNSGHLVVGGDRWSESHNGLGKPLDIRQTAKLIGCSRWSVRQTLIPRGLPFFRLSPRGRMIFFHDQVLNWIAKEQVRLQPVGAPAVRPRFTRR